MLVLGIETSGLNGSLALVRDEQCLVEQPLNQVGRRHAQSLVLEVGQALKSLGLTARDVDLVAVSHGPGSFTGLRVGMAFAKTFAYATGCRFIAVETFAAIAENVPDAIDRVFVVEDAQRSDLFVGEFCRRDSDGWTLAVPIEIVSVAQFLQQRSPSEVVAGPGLRKLAAVEQPRASWLTDDAICRPRALSIAVLGHRHSLAGLDQLPASVTDFWQAKPFYLRASAAEEKRLADEAAGHQSPTLPSG